MISGKGCLVFVICVKRLNWLKVNALAQSIFVRIQSLCIIGRVGLRWSIDGSTSVNEVYLTAFSVSQQRYLQRTTPYSSGKMVRSGIIFICVNFYPICAGHVNRLSSLYVRGPQPFEQKLFPKAYLIMTPKHLWPRRMRLLLNKCTINDKST